jgi:hypothetical protein
MDLSFRLYIEHGQNYSIIKTYEPDVHVGIGAGVTNASATLFRKCYSILPEVMVDEDCTRTVAMTPTISPSRGFLTSINIKQLYISMESFGTATLRATQWIINASYNQRQRLFHLSPEP